LVFHSAGRLLYGALAARANTPCSAPWTCLKMKSNADHGAIPAPQGTAKFRPNWCADTP